MGSADDKPPLGGGVGSFDDEEPPHGAAGYNASREALGQSQASVQSQESVPLAPPEEGYQRSRAGLPPPIVAGLASSSGHRGELAGLSAPPVDAQKIDLQQFLATADSLEAKVSFAPVEQVAPLVRRFIASSPEALRGECPGMESELLKLGQVLAAKFANECFQLKRAFNSLQDSLALAGQKVKELAETPRTEQLERAEAEKKDADEKIRALQAQLDELKAKHSDDDPRFLGRLLMSEGLQSGLLEDAIKHAMTKEQKMQNAIQTALTKEAMAKNAEQQLAELRLRCEKAEQELAEFRVQKELRAQPALGETDALRDRPNPNQEQKLAEMEALRKEQNQKLEESEMRIQQLQAALRATQEAQPQNPNADLQKQLANVLGKDAALSASGRFSPQNCAAVALQSAWRRKAAILRFNLHLRDLIFQPQGNSNLLRNRPPQGRAAVHSTVSSVRLVQAVMRRLCRRLERKGLDFESAYRCADNGYGGNVDSKRATAIMAGQFLSFICERQGISLPPAEFSSLLRLCKRQDRSNRDSAVPSKMPTQRTSDGELGEAWLWKMPYSFACELQAAFGSSSSRLTTEGGLSAATNALRSVRDLLTAPAGPDGAPRHCQFLWGQLAPSWRRIVVDAHLLQLMEERDKLQAALADKASSATRGPGKQGVPPLPGELESQLAACFAQAAAAQRPGASPCISASALTARLLREQLPLAPVTLHAAAKAGEISSRGCGPLLQRRAGMVQAPADLHSSFVEFDAPMPSVPNLIHVTAVADAPWSIRLDDVSANGMQLSVLLRDRSQSWETGDCSEGHGSWMENLQLAYSTGSAEGVLRIGPSPKGQKMVKAHFIPMLKHVPEFVFVESFVSTDEKILPVMPSGTSQDARQADRAAEIATWEVPPFVLAAGQLGSQGFFLRAVKPPSSGVRKAAGAATKLQKLPGDLVQIQGTASCEMELVLTAKWLQTETTEPPQRREQVPLGGAKVAEREPAAVRLRVPRSTSRGFVVMSPSRITKPLLYEAYSQETLVSAPQLQQEAPLPALGDGEEAEDLRLQAEQLPELTGPMPKTGTTQQPRSEANARAEWWLARRQAAPKLDSAGPKPQRAEVVEQPMGPPKSGKPRPPGGRGGE